MLPAPMLAKYRLIADRDRVIAQQLRVISTLKRHPEHTRTAGTVDVCLQVIADCERLKAVILATP
jgi:hypothetical protein